MVTGIEVAGVTKRYGHMVAIEDVSLSAACGEVYGLVGFNGAGKTTLLKTIAGVYLPDAGTVTFGGEDAHRGRTPLNAPFIVADEPYFLAQATPATMRDFFKGYYPRWSDATYEALLDLFDLDPKLKIAGFSKGMQRQMGLLLGLASGARYLLLDESFDGLDVSKRDLLKRLLRLYARSCDAAVVLSSHNMDELQDVSDRIGMIRDHGLAFDRPIADFHSGELNHLFLDEREVSDDELRSVFKW